MALSISNEVGQGLTAEEYRKLFEGNIYDKLKDTTQKEVTQKDDNKWFSRYSSRILELNPVDGMVEAIIKLEKEHTLTIVSSTINSPIKKYLAKHNLTSHFAKVFGADVHRSKVEKMKMIFSEFNVKSPDCVFITDTLGDMREAKKVSVDSIGVTWGFHQKETLLIGKPIKIVDSPSQLVSAINQIS